MITILQTCIQNHFPVVLETDHQKPVIQGECLLDQSELYRVLQDVQDSLKATTFFAAGSLFGKRYAGLSGIVFFLLTHQTSMLDVSLNNIQLQFDGKQLNFHFKDSRAYTITTRKQHEDAIKRILEENITPVFQSIADVSGIPVQTLWSHMAFKLYQIKHSLMGQTLDHSIKKAMEEDYVFLTKEANPTWFGLDRNPLDIEFIPIPHAYDDDKKTIQRHRCCFHYLTEGGRCCYTCPSMSDVEREERRKELKRKQV